LVQLFHVNFIPHYFKKIIVINFFQKGIIGRQFSELKRGDRFYYENGNDADSKFTPDQLTSIRGTLLASVLCKNIDINSVPKWPFLYPHPKFNPYYDCLRFGDYNLEPFVNPSTSSQTYSNQYPSQYPNQYPPLRPY
jgi:hypothetical protein